MARTIVIIGASSGIGLETARLFAGKGWRVGVAARRIEPMQQLEAEFAAGVITPAVIDVNADDAGDRLIALCDTLGGPDVILHCVGIGYTNRDADTQTDIDTVRTNVVAFTRIIDTAYHYMAHRGRPGHVAAITSVASTRGLGIAASYSASKRYQVNYLQALSQLAHLRHEPVTFTDIRPGFARTPLLDPTRRYPLLMSPATVARGIYRAITRGRRVAVIDWRWRLLVALWRLIPDAIWRRLPVDL